jgi:hypothetical protein
LSYRQGGEKLYIWVALNHYSKRTALDIGKGLEFSYNILPHIY